MHPLRHPRNAAILGIIFVITSVFFWAWSSLAKGHVDYAGITMLAILGIAMALMAYVLVAGSPED